MKKLIYILLVLAFGMASCFEDDTTLGTTEVGKIEIGELSDKTVVLFAGNHLQVSPDVKHGYAENEMSYAWYLINEKEMDNHNYRDAKRVADTKVLDLEVDNQEWNLVPGKYMLVFEIKAANSYTQTAEMTLTTSTGFSEGFYILKETADGNTELDLMTSENYFADLMEWKLGNALPGKPLNLAVIYDNGYLNENDELEPTNMVHVFAERDYHAFRTLDMMETFNRKTLMFEPMQEDELLYGMTTYANGNICFSNKGYYEFQSGENTGKLGLSVADGDMKGIQALVAGGTKGCCISWDEQAQALYKRVSRRGDILECPLPAGFENAELEYLASGMNATSLSNVAWFLCRDKNSGKRLLFQIKADLRFSGSWFMGATILDPTVSVVDEGKHLAKSQVMAGVGLGMPGIYVVDEGKIWLYNLENGEEIQVPLDGMEGEITYISNNYMNLADFFGNLLDGSFNYLLIATRNGDGYNLYVYDELVNGVPKKTTPKEVKKGENGVVRHIRYCSNAINSGTWDPFGCTTVYPYGD